MEKVLFLSGPLKERIWGGTYFKDVLKVTNSNDNIGELWSCSGHKEGESIVLNGEFKGKPLSLVYKENPSLFGNPKEKEFPILIKLIQTNDLLSVQVHPNDEYALKNENQFGKTEGWLILGSEEDSSIVIGHRAKNKEELVKYIDEDKIEELLNYTKVNRGEFYPIPSGTIHAIGKHILLLEVQQSSDVTYRFYDYHRKDKNGNERELHVKKAIDVTSYNPYNEIIKNCFENDKCLVWKNEYFEVNYICVKEELSLCAQNGYLIVSVIDGEIFVEGEKLTLGNSFIITAGEDETLIKGNGKIVITKYLK